MTDDADDPFRLDLIAAADQFPPDRDRTPTDLDGEVETMARRFAVGPMFLVHADDLPAAQAALDRLALLDGVDHRVTLRSSPFVPRLHLLVVTPEAVAVALAEHIDPATLATGEPHL